MSTTTSNQSESFNAPNNRRAESMRRAMLVACGGKGASDLASPKLRTLICPFCGDLTPDSGRCQGCNARFDPLSRQASQNQMGPWFVRDESMPHRPGCNYTTIKRLVESGGIEANSVLRGPSTRQFWMLAKHTPGVAQMFGLCHNCGEQVESQAFVCSSCQEPFSADRDRQHLGLGPSRPLPGQASVELLALRAEPPAGADQVSGPAAIPLASQESRSINAAGRRGSDTNTGEQELDAIKQVDELSRAVRALRRAWVSERKRAWVSVVCAGVVCVLALAVVLVS